jgi:hypothetical protein
MGRCSTMSFSGQYAPIVVTHLVRENIMFLVIADTTN